MARPLRATLLFQGFRRIEYHKDPGFVMHYLARHGMRTEVVALKWDDYRQPGFKGRVINVPKPFFLHAFKHVWTHAKEIDTLILFHTHPLNPIYGLVYKWRNPQGITYLKSDMDNTVLRMRTWTPLNLVRRFKLWANLLHVDLFSTEQRAVLVMLKKMHPRHASKMFLIENGFGGYATFPVRSWSKKEDRIVMVGPVGSPQKGTDLALDAFARIPDWGSWRVVMIGRVLDEYKPTFDAFVAAHPALKGRITLAGHVADRKEMLKHYDEARILFMPSRWETFSNALAEGAHFGDVIVSTPVGGAPEFTGDGTFGDLVPFGDTRAMAKALQKRMKDRKGLERDSKRTRERCDKRYSWNAISQRLYARITDARAKKLKRRA